jgi:gamma-glutamyltranspeptidase/glutathione hydrolase/leukotriene-C4 hydrolase
VDSSEGGLLVKEGRRAMDRW